MRSGSMSGVPRPSRRLVLLGGACLLAATGATEATQLWEQPGPHTTTPRARSRADHEAINSVSTSTNRLSVTFDDGPDPRFTPHVLDNLAAAGVHATFFIIGRNALAHPDLVKRIIAEGHEAANHTQDHLWLDTLPKATVRREIVEGAASLGANGTTPWFRPPRGWTSPTVADCCHGEGLRSVFWSDSFEGRQSHGVPEATRGLVENARPGSIILCHDGGALDGPNPQNIDRSRTVAALPGILAGLAAKNLQCVPLTTLIRG